MVSILVIGEIEREVEREVSQWNASQCTETPENLTKAVKSSFVWPHILSATHAQSLSVSPCEVWLQVEPLQKVSHTMNAMRCH